MNEAYNLFDKITDVLETWGVQAKEGKLQVGEILIQWGWSTATSAEKDNGLWGASQTISFPENFRTDNVFVWLTDDLGWSYQTSLGLMDAYHDKFTWGNLNTRQAATTIHVCWLAIGLAPN